LRKGKWKGEGEREGGKWGKGERKKEKGKREKGNGDREKEKGKGKRGKRKEKGERGNQERVLPVISDISVTATRTNKRSLTDSIITKLSKVDLP